MNTLLIEGGAKTPEVNFDPVTGIFHIRGRSIPKDADEFYNPVLEWLDGYTESPAATTKIHIDLDFFNISSSKRLLFLLYKLNDLNSNGFDIEVKWYYDAEEDDMYEVGQDYAFMVKMPFEFVAKERKLVAAS